MMMKVMKEGWKVAKITIIRYPIHNITRILFAFSFF